MSPIITAVIMGCMPSRKRRNGDNDDEYYTAGQSEQASSRPMGNNSTSSDGKNLNPKISMMSDHTLKLLQEIGELKVFTQVNPTESKQVLNKHMDLLKALENPQAVMQQTTSATTKPSESPEWKRQRKRDLKSYTNIVEEYMFGLRRRCACMNVMFTHYDELLFHHYIFTLLN